jgi:cyanophycinase-like exopeptidase
MPTLTLTRLALLAALLLSAHCLRLFMIGGKAYQDSLLFNDLAAAVAGR